MVELSGDSCACQLLFAVQRYKLKKNERDMMLRLSAKHLFRFSFRSILVILLIPVILLCITACQKVEQVVSSPEKIYITYSTASDAILAYITFAKSIISRQADGIASSTDASIKMHVPTDKKRIIMRNTI